MYATDLKRQEMSKLLSGIGFTLNGSQPSAFNAAEYKRVLDKVKGELPVVPDRIESILERYASGAGVPTAELVEAQPQWRQILPTLREHYHGVQEADVERADGERGG